MQSRRAKHVGLVVVATLLLALIPISTPLAHAEGCRDYPASVTPECAAQNLEEARLQTIAREEAARVEALAVIARAEAQRLADAQVNAARDSSYGATVQGCRDYPKSTTPECAAQNLEVERLASIDNATKAKQDEANVNAKAEAQRLGQAQAADARDTLYGATIKGCRDFPKSTTPECAAQNLEVERLASIDNAAKAKQDEADVNAKAEAQRLAQTQEADARDTLYGATIKGCRDFPKSTTPECAAQNLEVERLASIDNAAKAEQAEVDAKAKAERLADLETENEIKKVIRIKKVITCAKGSKTRTVTAWEPKCPKGYKKKGLTKNA